MMQIYSLIGYSLIVVHLVASGLAASADRGFVLGVAIGFAYGLFIWFFGGIYLSDILHMGIAHKSLAFKPWFVKFIAVFYNTAGIYINPVTWVNRHRHHHAFSDHEHDPNKRDSDGFFKTLYLCFFPYKCKSNLAQDRIFKTRPFWLVSNTYYEIFSQFSSYGVLWLILGDWLHTLVLWCGVRLFSIWLNMIQNYWAHERRFGTRRYDDEDNAMNLGEWLPVTATFSASLQNNHHHHPNFLRTSHDESEYDFGFLTVRAMKALGLVKPTASGLQKPEALPLQEVGL
jgi:fatty-acid desaturase